MYTLIRLREGVKAHGLAGRTAKAIAPYLGKPAMAKTMMPAGFVPIPPASVTTLSRCGLFPASGDTFFSDKGGQGDRLCRTLITMVCVVYAGPPSDAWANVPTSKPVHRKGSL